MQRKNNLLMPLKSPTNHNGFAMIIAVIVMITIATIIMFTLSKSTQTVKRTADSYLYEQAELHTKSAIEYALFRIAGEGCINNLNFTLDTIYDVNITARYVYTGATTNVAGTTNCNEYINPYITTNEQNGSVLMDIVISIDSADTGTDPIRYFRRTIQKL